MNIAFITTLQTNVGDDFVREGIRAVLDSLVRYRAYLINKHRPDETCTGPVPEDEGPLLGDKILDADATIQCGAPVYWNLGTGPGYRCSNAEWTEPLWYGRVALIHRERPVLNIAAGACQGYFGSASEITGEPECAEFVRRIHSYCKLTVVRDRMAEEVNARLGLDVLTLPCSSVHVWRKYPQPPDHRRWFALNFMPLAGHWNIEGKIDEAQWERDFLEIDRLLRRAGEQVALVAHKQDEAEAMRRILPGRTVFEGRTFADYLRFYGGCRGGIVNRVHGALVLAGRGVPSVLVGNDARALSVDEMGLPRCHVSEVEPARLVEQALELAASSQCKEDLLKAESECFTTLRERIRAVFRGRMTGGET